MTRTVPAASGAQGRQQSGQARLTQSLLCSPGRSRPGTSSRSRRCCADWPPWSAASHAISTPPCSSPARAVRPAARSCLILPAATTPTRGLPARSRPGWASKRRCTHRMPRRRSTCPDWRVGWPRPGTPALVPPARWKTTLVSAAGIVPLLEVVGYCVAPRPSLLAAGAAAGLRPDRHCHDAVRGDDAADPGSPPVPVPGTGPRATGGGS